MGAYGMGACKIQQAPPPVVADEPSAPNRWKAVQVPDSGKTYWYHKETRETTWRDPAKPRKTNKKKKKIAPVEDLDVALYKQAFQFCDVDGSGLISSGLIKEDERFLNRASLDYVCEVTSRVDDYGVSRAS